MPSYKLDGICLLDSKWSTTQFTALNFLVWKVIN